MGVGWYSNFALDQRRWVPAAHFDLTCFKWHSSWQQPELPQFQTNTSQYLTDYRVTFEKELLPQIIGTNNQSDLRHFRYISPASGSRLGDLTRSFYIIIIMDCEWSCNNLMSLKWHANAERRCTSSPQQFPAPSFRFDCKWLLASWYQKVQLENNNNNNCA